MNVIAINKLRDSKFIKVYRNSRSRYFDIVDDVFADPEDRILAAIWLIDDLMLFASDLHEASVSRPINNEGAS